MLRGSREDMLDGRPRPCEKRYIAGYEPEYEECRLKFRENSLPTQLPPQTPSQDTSISRLLLPVPQPAHKYPSIEHPPKTTSRCHSQEQTALQATHSQQCSSPTSAVQLVRLATLKRARAPTLECVSSSSTEKTRRRSRDVDHLAAQ